MLSSYRRVLSIPGAALMSGTGTLARLPMSMMTLGIVVAISAGYDSYGLAGQVSAAYIVGNAVVAVLQGRLADRFGQAPVLLVDAVLFGAATGLLVRSIVAQQAAPWPHLWAAAAGMALPQVGAMVRARWTDLVPDADHRHTAFAVESVADEVVFVAGPALVTFLSTLLAAETGLLVALVVGTVGPLLLALQRRTEPPARPRRGSGHATAPMPWGTLLPVTIVAAALGSLFGGMEVAAVAFATDEGHRAVSGVLLAALSLASMVAGVLTGARHFAMSLLARVRIGMAGLTAAFVVLPFLDNLWSLTAMMFVAGFAIAPTLIATLSLVEQISPRGRLTEAMAWAQTGLSAGIAPGAWLAGVVADHHGGAPAFWICVGSGAVATLAAVLTRLPRPSRAAEVLSSPA